MIQKLKSWKLYLTAKAKEFLIQTKSCEHEHPYDGNFPYEIKLYFKSTC